MIKSIHIKNVKGISDQKFDLNIYPNKPSLLVAPNGFGKSSFATAFKSLNNRKIDLDKNSYYQSDESNLPELIIEYKNDSNSYTWKATSTTNDISSHIQCFVINSQLKPKGVGSIHGRTIATLDIENVILVDKIPENISINYNLTDVKNKFGKNAKILSSIQKYLEDINFIKTIIDNFKHFEKYNDNSDFKNFLDNLIYNINLKSGDSNSIKQHIDSTMIDSFLSNSIFNNIFTKFEGFYKETNTVDKILHTIQLFLFLSQKEKQLLKKYLKYREYKQKYDYSKDVISKFNATWKDIKVKRKNDQLIVEFPNAHFISNGQRDILTFVSMLLKAEFSLTGDINILIIDEVFDYLDDANLVAAQYYISEFIDNYKKNGKKIYPLLLTHINPNYFKSYAFNEQKIYFLNKSSAVVNRSLINLLRKRNNPTIEDDVSKYILHFHTDEINKRAEFKSLGLKETWGERNNFQLFLESEVNNFKLDQNYDPFAVCAALRVRIEKNVYNMLVDNGQKQIFLDTHSTVEKLDKAVEFGVNISEVYYLLKVVYNEALHWKENVDNVSPVASKLENLVLKGLIKDIFA